MEISIEQVLAKLDELAAKIVRQELVIELQAARIAEMEAELATPKGRKQPKP